METIAFTDFAAIKLGLKTEKKLLGQLCAERSRTIEALKQELALRDQKHAAELSQVRGNCDALKEANRIFVDTLTAIQKALEGAELSDLEAAGYLASGVLDLRKELDETKTRQKTFEETLWKVVRGVPTHWTGPESRLLFKVCALEREASAKTRKPKARQKK